MHRPLRRLHTVPIPIIQPIHRRGSKPSNINNQSIFMRQDIPKTTPSDFLDRTARDKLPGHPYRLHPSANHRLILQHVYFVHVPGVVYLFPAHLCACVYLLEGGWGWGC